MQWLCSQLCYITSANHWTIVDIELLATVGWKWGCQPFSCRCLQNVTHWRKEICSTCLFQESTPAIPFGNWNSKHPLPARSRFPRAASHSTICALCLRYACKRFDLFVEDSGFVSYAEKHRFGHGVVVSKVCYGILECVFFPFAMSTIAMCGDWAFSNSGLEWGCQPVSCRCLQNVTHCRNETCSTCLSRESILRNSKHPGSWEPQHAPLVLHCGCIMPIPSLQLQEIARVMQRSRGFGRGVKDYSDLRCFHVTTAKQWMILEVELLTTVDWKWGCQPFSCPCSQNEITEL